MRMYRLSVVVLVAALILPQIARSEIIILERGSGVKHGRGWGPEQALGAPDTLGSGDIQTAWASNTPDGQEEWLELDFEKEVLPAEVVVHETYNPGALVRVTAYTKTGMAAELWAGKDPTPTTAARGISRVKVDPGFKIKRIRIHLNSKGVSGWNEIDAVGLKDKEGKTHWAVSAKASSTFAGGAAEGWLPKVVGAAPKLDVRKLIGIPPPMIKPPAIPRVVIKPFRARDAEAVGRDREAALQAEIEKLKAQLAVSQAENAQSIVRQELLQAELNRVLIILRDRKVAEEKRRKEKVNAP
jgi:hypothetical protein